MTQAVQAHSAAPRVFIPSDDTASSGPSTPAHNAQSAATPHSLRSAMRNPQAPRLVPLHARAPTAPALRSVVHSTHSFSNGSLNGAGTQAVIGSSQVITDQGHPYYVPTSEHHRNASAPASASAQPQSPALNATASALVTDAAASLPQSSPEPSQHDAALAADSDDATRTDRKQRNGQPAQLRRGSIVETPDLENQDHPQARHDTLVLRSRPKPNSWANSKGLAVVIAEEFEGAGPVGKVAGGIVRFVGSSVKLPFQCAGAVVIGGVNFPLCAAGTILTAISSICCEGPREVTQAFASETWNQTKLFFVTVGEVGGTALGGVPTYLASCCCSDAVNDCEMSLYRSIDTCFESPQAPLPLPLSQEIQLAIKKSYYMRTLNWMTDTPGHIKEHTIPKTVSEASRDCCYASIQDCEEAPGYTCLPLLGAFSRLVRKSFNVGCMAVGSPAALTVSAGLGVVGWAPLKLVGCCSDSSDRVANGFGKAAAACGKMGLVALGRVAVSPVSAAQYILGHCSPKVDDCCTTECDKPFFKWFDKTCMPKNINKITHLNAPVPTSERIFTLINDSPPMEFLKWLCDQEGFNYMANQVAIHRHAASLGGNLRHG